MKYEEHDVIEACSYVLHNFYHHDIKKVYDVADEKFVWIGTKAFQWAVGLDQFKFVTATESKDAPIFLTNEEYYVLRQEGCLWVIYGRYDVQAVFDDGTIYPATVRITFIWEETKAGLRILHVHGSNAKDAVLNEKPFEPENSFFEYIKHLHVPYHTSYKIAICDRSRHHRYLNLSDIMYIEAQDRFLYIKTKTDGFQARGRISEIQLKLSNDFIRIHRSYIINRLFIDHITRNSAVLSSQEELPISRDRYPKVKQWLEKSHT